MGKLQYDSFYKFLVSIGIILIVAPLFAIYYIVSGTYSIILSKVEYGNLSPLSLDLLNMKISCLNTIYKCLPIACIILILIGGFCIFWGCRKWHEIQKALDEITLLDLQEKKSNIEKMSATEIVEKAIKEEVEVQEEALSTDLSTRTESSDSFNSVTSKMLKAIQVQEACFKYVKSKLDKNYVVHQNVKVANSEYDIIASSKNDNLDFLYEIKYWTHHVSVSTIYYLFKSAEARGRAYEKNTCRNFRFIIMIVSTQDGIQSIKPQLEQHMLDKKYTYITLEFIEENYLDIE